MEDSSAEFAAHLAAEGRHAAAALAAQGPLRRRLLAEMMASLPDLQVFILQHLHLMSSLLLQLT